ncbi:MAG: GntR family transcriptional regulator [Hyphomicrobiaceae bacterium]|nr:GntR family transcriptional regulator [Hyphomicrobiaceae bacterium]
MARQTTTTKSRSRPAASSRGKRDTKPAGRTIVRTTLSEQTYEAIKEQILDQTLPPGARLNIDLLSHDLGVSSSPVREALARLEAERLVVSELYSGYSVAPSPSLEYLRDLNAYRLVIETHCALIGAPKRKKTVLTQMRQAFDRMAAVPQLGTRYREYRRFVQADMRFHEVLVASAENEVMSDSHASLHPIIIQSRLYLNREGGTTSSDEVMAEHSRIIEAFENGDGEAAAAAVRHHLEGGRRRLLAGADEEA